MKPELAIEPDMLRTLREGEKPGMAGAPALEGIADGGNEALADARIPQIGPRRQRPEKPDAAPIRREIRAGERAILLSRERYGVFGAEARMGIRRKPEFLD